MALKKDDFLETRLKQEAEKASKAASNKGWRITSIYLNGDLAKRLKKQVETKGVGQSSLIRVAIENLLTQLEGKK